jgi:hypothetical protein
MSKISQMETDLRYLLSFSLISSMEFLKGKDLANAVCS